MMIVLTVLAALTGVRVAQDGEGIISSFQSLSDLAK